MAARRQGRKKNLSQADREFINYAKEYTRDVGQAYVLQLQERDTISLISELSKRSRRFRNASFFCSTCNYFMEREEMEKHRTTYAHTRKIKVCREDEELRSIEGPSDDHISVLSKYLDETYDRVRLHDADKRMQVVEELRVAVHQGCALAGVGLEVTGSVRAGFALKDSDTNIRIVAANDANYLSIFREIHRVLVNQGRRYSNIVIDVESRSPYISFTTPDASGTFHMRVVDEGNHHTHVILSAYSQWHPMARQLGVLFKYCAKQGSVTDVEKGGLLPMCIAILAIYFCQQKKLIPVLIKAEDVIDTTGEELGEIVDRQLQNLDEALSSARRRRAPQWHKVLKKFHNNWNGENIAELWLDMLRFYSLEFELEKTCVSLINIGRVKKETKSWQRWKKMVIEEPGSPERNLAQMTSNQQVLDFVSDYIRSCYLHFGVHEVRGNRRFSFNAGQLKEMEKHFPIFCRDCHAPDHRAIECPAGWLPECQKLPTLNNSEKKVVNDLLLMVKEEMQLTDQDRRKRKKFFRTVADLLQSVYPDARVEVFGSSENGFGSYNSDIDVTLVFDECYQLDRDGVEDIIEEVESVMKRARGIEDVQAVLDSKVPVVNFYDSNSQLHCDISVNNRLAIRNTKMLLRYSQLDERFRTLGLCVKIFAKECGMADAYQRTLSSYAYILMMIFYLQRCDPPVLPVLQELHGEGDKPVEMVDGWNAWFYSGALRDVRPRRRRIGLNTQDVSELWLGFLDFYSQKFDYKRQVVSIRTAHTVTKMEKLWNSDMLAIEDPFKTDHNLAKALTKKSNARILGNLITGRNIFGSPIQSFQERNDFEYFFQHESLMLPEN